MQYWFIINPRSGKKNNTRKIINLIERRFSQRENISYKIFFTQRAGHARELAEEAAKLKIDIVAAAGGDGTMNETASGIVNSQTALGLIPQGSGNGFARSLGIPLKIDSAIEFLLHPAICSIDVGMINNYYFFGVAGIGLDAEISAVFQEFGVRGAIPYFYLGTKEFIKFKYEEYEVIFNDKKIITKPLLITVANTSQYGNGAVIAPRADFKDGLLDICIIEKTSFIEAVTKFSVLFNNKIDSFSSYSRFQTDKLKIIRTKNEGFFHTDGEPRRGGKELDIRILPKALRVCA